MRAIWLLAFAVSLGAQVAPTVFLKDSEVYVRANGAPQDVRITADGQKKSHLVQSKDGRRLAFVREKAGGMMADIMVMSTDGKNSREIIFRPPEANVSGMRFVENMEWMSKQRLVVSGSVNPSTVEYAVIDVETGDEVEGYLVDGLAWAASPDGMHAAYVGYVPHFTPEKRRRPQFCIDDECSLEKPLGGYPGAGEHLEFTSEPLWSEDSKAVAMIAEEYGSKAERVIVRPLGGKPLVFVAPLGLAGNLVAGWEGTALVIRAGKKIWKLERGSSSFAPQAPI